MKNLCFIFLLVMLAGCSDKYESLVQSAPPPVLSFGSDTLCIREKDPTNVNGTGKGVLTIHCSPAGHQFNLSFSDTSGKLHFVYRGTSLADSKPFVVTGDANTLYCYADAAGVYAVDFTLTDQLGKTCTRTLIVRCSAGVKPKAALSWEQIGLENGNWQYYFNAAGSSQPFGTIMSYHYLIDNDTVIVSRPILKYFFHTAGQHSISFFVVDDLNLSSDTLNYSILTQ